MFLLTTLKGGPHYLFFINKHPETQNLLNLPQFIDQGQNQNMVPDLTISEPNDLGTLPQWCFEEGVSFYLFVRQELSQDSLVAQW